MTHDPPGLCMLRHDKKWLCFKNPRAVIQTHSLAEVLPCLESIEKETSRGLHAVGFVSYEAAPAFDQAMKTKPAGDLPLLWFGLYENVEEINLSYGETCDLSRQPDTSEEEFHRSVSRIKDYIARGDTYQVNFSFRLRSPSPDDPLQLFHQLSRAQPSPYSAYLDIGNHVICSASPELFFRLDGNQITRRPMKGTSSRGVTLEDDQNLAEQLIHSAKNRAENLMIVDMMRNDLGQIARTGSVAVSTLFELEKYPTLFQLTSTITAQTSATLPDVLRALFPCASVTGAPKIRTMEIIAELEKTPRGIYTGALGYIGPNRQAQFNVAIRTAQIDKTKNDMNYGVGSGIVWDSDPVSEFHECLTKALILTETPSFQLIETMRWEPDNGYYFLDLHLHRLSQSAAYFDYKIDPKEIRERLFAEAQKFTQSQRVRLVVDHIVTIESEPLSTSFQTDTKASTLFSKIRLADQPISSLDRFLYHKTTQRSMYNPLPDCDDTIFWNERGEITESTIANVVVEKDGVLYTPPVSSGLLAGTFREDLLRRNIMREKVITLLAYEEADAIYLINSVRGWIKTWQGRLSEPSTARSESAPYLEKPYSARTRNS